MRTTAYSEETNTTPAKPLDLADHIRAAIADWHIETGLKLTVAAMRQPQDWQDFQHPASRRAYSAEE